MSLTLKITTEEAPGKRTPWKQVITEELIGIPPKEAYDYIEKEVLNVPEKKWNSLEEYWKECWAGFSNVESHNMKIVESSFKYYNSRYEFWVEEKTGESLKKWMEELKSPSFTIQFENMSIEISNNSLSQEERTSNG